MYTSFSVVFLTYVLNSLLSTDIFTGHLQRNLSQNTRLQRIRKEYNVHVLYQLKLVTEDPAAEDTQGV